MPGKIKLPTVLEPLNELSYNLWFGWNPDARDLFREIDIALWNKTGRNPAAFLKHVDPKLLETFANNNDFVNKVNKVFNRYKTYMENKSTLFSQNYSNHENNIIAYFSAEYGIHESLPNYAGGLGILSGDHCKTASDIGLPFVAVGLMYKHAYFTQYINEAGEQVEDYNELVLEELPITLLKDESDKPLTVSVTILERDVLLQIWQVKVGRISLYLLDTNVEGNIEEDKQIIHSLYGGSRDTRIQQEIILGIGGLRALRKIGIDPSVFHMNEGHSAFLGFERLYELLSDGWDFNPALEYIRSTTLFTTHTPIAAGNETFEFDMMFRYFHNYWPKLGMTEQYFFDLGRNLNEHQHENYSLTILALNFSYMANGVSKLHSEVSKKMWHHVYPGVPVHEVPIGHVTNGIHTESWLHREMIKLFDTYFDSDWREHIHEEGYWAKIDNIPEDVYWETMLRMKEDMIRVLSSVYKNQLARYSDGHGFPPIEGLYDENALTIGFARRFAPYKRATLLFNDRERIKKILNSSDKPVQILFSGKAHPQNDAGKSLIKEINTIAREEGFKGKIIFVENYHINISRMLVSGVDIWLNNPRRPLEASGTSGQKVPINGGINFSVLDGWWPEGYNGQNGWIIGREFDYLDHTQQDIEDSTMMYESLEDEIIPLFYKRDEKGIPIDWIKKSKESFKSNFTKFSTHTMLWNYTQKYYVPGIERNKKYTQNDSALLVKFTIWMNRVKKHWKDVNLSFKNGIDNDDKRTLAAGETKKISVVLDTGYLTMADLKLEVTLERQDSIEGNKDLIIEPMQPAGTGSEYYAKITAQNDGTYRYNCRVFPFNPDFFNIHETRLIKWLD